MLVEKYEMWFARSRGRALVSVPIFIEV